VSVLQAFLNCILFIIYLLICLLSVLGIIDNRFAFSLDIQDTSFVINLSVLTAPLFGLWLLFYASIYLRALILCLKGLWKSKKNNDDPEIVPRRPDHNDAITRRRKFFVKFISILVNAMIAIFWIWFIIYQINIHNNGHVPFLDVNYRDYDLESICWSGVGILLMDENMIVDNNCFFVDNKLIQTHYFKVKCVSCRKLIKEDEKTFFNQNFVATILSVLTLLIVQLWNLYVFLKKSNANADTSSKNTKHNDIYMKTYAPMYCDDNEEADEKSSEIRCFEEIYSARKSQNSKASSRSNPVSVVREDIDVDALIAAFDNLNFKYDLPSTPPPPPPPPPLLSHVDASPGVCAAVAPVAVVPVTVEQQYSVPARVLRPVAPPKPRKIKSMNS
jgi:hypothetical protein